VEIEVIMWGMDMMPLGEIDSTGVSQVSYLLLWVHQPVLTQHHF
jgi:hypothetical protein